MKKGSIKNNRINGEVQRELSCIIRDGVKDPRIDPLMTVNRVEVTPDLQFCKCFVSTIGAGDSLERTIEGLQNAEGYIRRELAHRVNLRKTPKLQFVADHSIEYAIEMSKRIEELARKGGTGTAFEEADCGDEDSMEDADYDDADFEEADFEDEDAEDADHEEADFEEDFDDADGEDEEV